MKIDKNIMQIIKDSQPVEVDVSEADENSILDILNKFSEEGKEE